MFRSQPCVGRHKDQIVLYLSKGYPMPPMPVELHSYLSSDDWAIRVPALTHLVAKYNKPLFERVWLVFTVVISLILPLTLFHPLYSVIYESDASRNSKDMVAGVIGFLIFLVAFLLFWTPLMMWKKIGNHRVRSVLESYSAMDAEHSSIGFVPKWKISTPGVFSSHTILTITIPPTGRITYFHPDAYLPAYVSKTEEAQAAYFYPYPADSHEIGLPRMSVIGGRYGTQGKV